MTPLEPTWICATCGMANSFDFDKCSICHNPMSILQKVSPCPTFDEYQELAARTRGVWDNQEKRLIIGALGLAGEAGEVCDLIKKVYGQGHELNIEKLKDELGDPLWYLADICSALGITLSEVAQWNIAKLHERYPNGFDKEISKGRYK